MRVGKEVSFMPEGKTIGQLMEEMRQKAGAQNYHGHDYMDLQRFAENTRHMITPVRTNCLASLPGLKEKTIFPS